MFTCTSQMQIITFTQLLYLNTTLIDYFYFYTTLKLLLHYILEYFLLHYIYVTAIVVIYCAHLFLQNN